MPDNRVLSLDFGNIKNFYNAIDTILISRIQGKHIGFLSQNFLPTYWSLIEAYDTFTGACWNFMEACWTFTDAYWTFTDACWNLLETYYIFREAR